MDSKDVHGTPTLKITVPLVRLQMLRQVVTSTELFLAEHTMEWSLARVHRSDMSLEMFASPEGLIALRTLELFCRFIIQG